ncbi:MAG: FixH family protein [Chloroflexi bacterium]|nr:FixH family protein [Chloroflexota bacterium]
MATDVTVAIKVEPDPPAVGEANLRITLTGAGGAPIDGANVRARGDMDHAGMTPVLGETTQSQNGVYEVPFNWSMGGGWIVEVTATLPDNRGIAQEKFEFFVSAVSADSVINSDAAAEATAAGDEGSTNALRIVIPAGTGAQIEAGQDPGLIPAEIRLRLSEQNVLIIANEDSVDHTVGPFFVRAGESIRQEFARPAVFEGACSIHQGQQVRIVIEA